MLVQIDESSEQRKRNSTQCLLSIMTNTFTYRWRFTSGTRWQPAGSSQVWRACVQTVRPLLRRQCPHSNMLYSNDWGMLSSTSCTTNRLLHHCSVHWISHRCLYPEYWTPSRCWFYLDGQGWRARRRRLRWIRTRADGSCRSLVPRKTTNIRPSTTDPCLDWSKHTHTLSIGPSLRRISIPVGHVRRLRPKLYRSICHCICCKLGCIVYRQQIY